jgi:hypothetical protein
MTPRQIVAALAVVGVALAAGLWIIRSPLYPRLSAEECHAAYRRATTRGDTTRVDLHPYSPRTRDRAKHRCGEVRARFVATQADLLPR